MRLLPPLLALLLFAAACSSSGGSDAVAPAVDAGASSTDADADVEDSPTTVNPLTEVETPHSALFGDRNHPSFPPPVVDPSLIVSGGPPPDGIPPIDSPQFLPVSDADFFDDDDEAVIALEIDGDARAYPIRILIWHEIVNDSFGDVPVTVTYCPLCNSALAYDGRVEQADGSFETFTFGTSGSLYQSALVMYDRQTNSLWAHFTGQAIVGHVAGTRLDLLPAQTLSIAQFAERYPDGLVLTEDTGHDRPYGSNPYEGYDEENSGPIGGFFNGPIDERLASKARIVGIIADASGGADVAAPASAAIRTETVESAGGALEVEVDGRALTVWIEPGLASSLERSGVADGRDVGATGVFVPVAEDGTALRFERSDAGFVDSETGSTWDITGLAVDGALAGQQLEPIVHLDTFWFAWATYRPDTVLLDG